MILLAEVERRAAERAAGDPGSAVWTGKAKK